MNRADVEIFNRMPVSFFVKDEAGRYLFASGVIHEMAGGDPAGKTDHDMPWAADADAFREHEWRVLDTGETLYAHERGHLPNGDTVVLSICKWAGEFEGQRCVLGIGFPIPKDQL
ncbi:MAG: PAS domain-containing protein [Miltoncostaeaceae bacterium]